MNTVYFCFTVDDVGMQVYSSESHLESLLRFCEQERLKATLFVVPRPGGEDLRAKRGFINILKRAAADGHELGQHGLEHDRFESGIPPRMVLDLPHEGPARERLAKHRPQIEAALTVDNLRRMLREGREILEDALGQPFRGFRAPCISTCDNLYAALEAEGYLHDSSTVFQEAAWDIINGVKEIVPRPITREIFDSRQKPGALKVLPITAEYAWYLRNDKYEATLELARYDFDACLEAGIPCVTLCHVSPLQEGDEGLGFRLFHELVAHARSAAEKQGKRFVSETLAGVCRRHPHLWAGKEQEQ